MHPRRSRWFFIVIIPVCLLITISLPYILASRASGSGYIFGGFLLNPLDGNSYLAKMYSGWKGEWLFTLPYTAEKGEGRFLFVFYLFLGDLARLAHLPLITTFHLARILAALLLLVSLYRFLGFVLIERRAAQLAFVLAMFGSGMGWIALLAGAFTSDFWVAETYPFLSAYANPHFPLGLALVLWMLTPDPKGSEGRRDDQMVIARNPAIARDQLAKGLRFAIASLGLAAISPFAVVLVVAVLSTLLLVEFCQRLLENYRAGEEINPSWRLGLVAEILPGWARPLKPFDPLFKRLPWIFIGGAPLLVYEAWIVRMDPLLAGWNAQNLTPSPPVWDLVIALSPVLFFAIPGTLAAIKEGTLGNRLLLTWVVISLSLLYFPFSLQRRFMLGLYIPFAALAALGVHRLATSRDRSSFRQGRFNVLVVFLLLMALPTNLVVLLAARQGIGSHDPHLYLSQGEAQAFQWLSKNTPAEAIILAAPDTGLWIPAYTGRRVLYGHPFETVDAEIKREWVEKVFRGDSLDPTTLNEEIDYIFFGPRERELNPGLTFPGLFPAYQMGGVSLYAVPPTR